MSLTLQLQTFQKPDLGPNFGYLENNQIGSKIKGTPLRKNHPRQKLRFGPKNIPLHLYAHWATPVGAI